MVPLYKTIVLAMLEEQYPALHQQLRENRTLLSAMNDYATALRTAHRTWMDELGAANPGLDSAQLSSEALELALTDLREALPSASATDEADPLSLGEAMSSIRRHSPPA